MVAFSKVKFVFLEDRSRRWAEEVKWFTVASERGGRVFILSNRYSSLEVMSAIRALGLDFG